MSIQDDIYPLALNVEQGFAPAVTTTTKGLVTVFTGGGKGKSTAALGMAWRALYHQQRVGVVQFIGGPDAIAASRTLGQQALCEFKIFGTTCRWTTETRAADAAEMAIAWSEAQRMLNSPAFKLVILDGINLLLRHQVLSIDMVMLALERKREAVNVVLTGQHAPLELIDFADIATEMRNCKAKPKVDAMGNVVTKNAASPKLPAAVAGIHY